MPGNSSREILKHYLDEERELEKKLHDCENLRYELKFRVTHDNYESIITNLHLNREACLFRNRQMLKDLEKSKARLRTLTTFTPTDQELRDFAAFYRNFLEAEKKNLNYDCITKYK